VFGITRKTTVKMVGRMKADFADPDHQKSRRGKHRDVRPRQPAFLAPFSRACFQSQQVSPSQIVEPSLIYCEPKRIFVLK